MDVKQHVEAVLNDLTFVNSRVDYVCYWGQPHNEAQLILKPHSTLKEFDLNALKDLFKTDLVTFRAGQRSSIWFKFTNRK